MAKFTDRQKREWILDLDVYLVEQIQKKTEVRVDQLIAEKAAGLVELFSDPIKFVRVLWVMIEEQAAKASVTPEQFGRSLGGDALEEAANAFVESLTDFFPHRQRKVLRNLMAKGQEIAESQRQKALRAIEKLNPESWNSAGTPPASSASTPAAEG
jgi:hypothetical protein